MKTDDPMNDRRRTTVETRGDDDHEIDETPGAIFLSNDLYKLIIIAFNSYS